MASIDVREKKQRKTSPWGVGAIALLRRRDPLRGGDDDFVIMHKKLGISNADIAPYTSLALPVLGD